MQGLVIYTLYLSLGIIKVTGGLDVEVVSIYEFSVEARDRDDSTLFDIATVYIKVQNVNDKSPVFTQVSLARWTQAVNPCLLSLKHFYRANAASFTAKSGHSG